MPALSGPLARAELDSAALASYPGDETLDPIKMTFSPNRTLVVEVKLDIETVRSIRRAARHTDQTENQFIRQAAEEKAARVNRQQALRATMNKVAEGLKWSRGKQNTTMSGLNSWQGRKLFDPDADSQSSGQFEAFLSETPSTYRG